MREDEAELLANTTLLLLLYHIFLMSIMVLSACCVYSIYIYILLAVYSMCQKNVVLSEVAYAPFLIFIFALEFLLNIIFLFVFSILHM